MLVDPANTMTELLRFSVNLTQKAADRLVEGSKREEAAVPQPRPNPATNDLYPHLNFGFVLIDDMGVLAIWRGGKYRREPRGGGFPSGPGKTPPGRPPCEKLFR